MLSIAKDFLLQLSFIATLIFIYQIFLENRIETSRFARFVYFCLLGLSAVLCMLFRAHISTSLDLDIRIVPLILGTLYGGWRTGLFLSAVIILYRLSLGIDLGLATTIIALSAGVPVFIAYHKVFIAGNTKKKLLIAISLSTYYLLVGLISANLLDQLSFKFLQAALTQLIVAVLFVALFVYLYEMIKQTLSRNLQLQSEVKEAEISFLRAQIKPHFLYNALNSISALCDIDPARARDTTDELANYLRSRFDFANMNQAVDLKKELEYVKSYINVEKARFGDRLQVEYQIDADLNLQIPPLVLQPIVENAVKHGLQSRRSGGTVGIFIKQSTKGVEIRISDNGKGMSLQKIEQILGDLGRSGIGLRNVNARLKKRYGQGLSILSEPGKGTAVIIRIPVGMKL